jgi:hypothetical protein
VADVGEECGEDDPDDAAGDPRGLHAGSVSYKPTALV